MSMKKIKITIATDGTYTMKAEEGFAGASCVEKTQTIEQLIGAGATVTSEGKTDDYYKADEDATIVKDIFGML